MSVKDRIKIFIEYKGLTITAFEKSINVTNGYINSISKSIGIDKINTILENYPNLNLEWLFTGNGQMIKKLSEVENWIDDELDILREEKISSEVYKMKTDKVMQKQSVPLYDIQASASVVALFRDQNQQTPIDHITIPNLPKCDGAIYVSGDSMYPLLKSGDIIMYKKVENALDAIFWGEMYLVSIINDYGDEFVMIKWLQKSEQGKEFVKLVSENRHHQPTEFHIKNIKGLALIKASVRINSMY